MADLLVGPVMDKIIDKCFEYFKDQIVWQSGMKEELERLRIIRPKIQAVLSVYNQVEIKDPYLNKWYWQLRDAIDEADDVLDDFEYRKYQKRVSNNKAAEKGVQIFQRAVKKDPDLKKLEEAVQKLHKISAEVSPFLNLLDSAKQEEKQQQLELLKKRETGALTKNVILGRSEEMEFILQWLKNTYETQSIDITDLYRNISLLSIVGYGGMGKTTLLQHVYKNAATDHFDVKIWVCVSTSFDAKTVIKNIIEYLQNQRPDSESLAVLQNTLQTKVASKRFLLVLDDIWEADEGKWEDVLAPLQDGNQGSKILITTRMDSVASKIPIENKRTYQLKGLEENECFLIFKAHAFGKSSYINESLLHMAGDIVKKLSGSPLGAKIVGSSLKSKDVSYWRKVLNTDIGIVGHNDIFPILKLSYTYLPNFLQICFAFCCIFEQDHRFDKDDLVKMWISLGFIQSQYNSQETIEEIGRSYFDILVEKSFFDKFQDKYNNRVYYQMHDLLHELAQLVSKQECLRAVDVEELPSPPKTIQHLSLDIHGSLEEAFKKMGDLKNLRSLFLSYRPNYDENFVDVISKIFEASKSIRLLYIFAPGKKESCEIGCLTHLRYFQLHGDFGQLPRSISQLYHLQIIIFLNYNYFMNYDDFLPKDINNLANLRCLRLPFYVKGMICEIGKLNSLQELSHFYVENEIGYGIEELEHVNELRQIRINQLENIIDAGEAWSAKFSDKKNLTDLSLKWGGVHGNRKNIVDHDLDEKVLDSIQPNNKSLKRLKINAYMGVRSSIWMSDLSIFLNLEYIKLDQCLKWKTLPPFGQLPFLKSLYLHNMPEVEQLDHKKDCMFRSLEVLDIQNLQALHEWFDATVAATKNEYFLPCLSTLRLWNCPKLQELTSLPTELQKLEMYNIGWKGCKWLQGIRNCSSINIRCSPNLIRLSGRQELETNENFQLIIDELAINDPSMLLMEPLRSISSLRSLTIGKNGELVSFPSETELWSPQLISSSLLKLEFYSLKSLQSLSSSLESFSSLETLCLFSIPQLKLLPNPPASLVTLELCYLESLQCLPSSLSTISSLRNIHLKGLENLDCPPSFLPTLLRVLTIDEVPRLLELPDLPFSLEKLELKYLKSLNCLPSSLSAISSLDTLKLRNIPLLQSLPDFPSSLKKLEIEKLESLQCLPSSLSTISSLTNLTLKHIPLRQSLSELPSSLEDLELVALKCLPSSLSTISSLTNLKLRNIPLLQSLADLPSSVKKLDLQELELLQLLPSSLSNFSLTHLKLINVPLLQSLPEFPSSLEELELEQLQCLPSSLSTLSSLRNLKLKNIPLLKSLSDLHSSVKKIDLQELESLQFLPSSLSNFSFFYLELINIPLLQSLPDLPSSPEHLDTLKLENLPLLKVENFPLLICSLRSLELKNIPLLKSLSDLPFSLLRLILEDLENLDCLPSCLPASLEYLWIKKVPRLMELPDLPSSLIRLNIQECQPQLMQRYPNFSRGQ